VLYASRPAFEAIRQYARKRGVAMGTAAAELLDRACGIEQREGAEPPITPDRPTWAIVPRGTEDTKAAGIQPNAFPSRERARLAIEVLCEQDPGFYGEPDEWEIVGL